MAVCDSLCGWDVPAWALPAVQGGFVLRAGALPKLCYCREDKIHLLTPVVSFTPVFFHQESFPATE